MENIKLFLLIECLLQLFVSFKIETIEYINPIEIKGVINQKKLYEITFSSENIPDFLQINFNSANNARLVVSYSSTDQNCLNYQSMGINNILYLEKSQLSFEKNYICVECENPNESCGFKFSLKPGKKGIKIREEKKIQSKNFLLSQNEEDKEDDDVKLMISQNTTVNLYILRSLFSDKLSIPNSKIQKYQIDSGKSGKYKIISGESVTVSSDGLILPKNKTWYCVQKSFGICTTWPSGDPDEVVDVRYTPGTSEVQATVNDKAYIITVNVIDYAEEYVDNKLKDYIKKNVTTKSTQLEQYDSIAYYPAKFPYNYKYSGSTTMVIYEGGDCWASTDTIVRLCNMVGIKAHGRSASRDSGAGSSHENAIALINGKYYIAEAGYGYEYANRPYRVYEEPLGYSTKYYTKDSIIVYQYDGYDLDIRIPSSINGKTVVGLQGPVFNGPSEDAINIVIPNTVTFLGDRVFAYLTKMEKITITKNISSIGYNNFYESYKVEKIEVEKGNKAFCSQNGVLYTKNKTILISYPPAKKEEKYDGPSSVKIFANYSFYETKMVNAVVIPEETTFIGARAFGWSNIKEIYYAGNPPTFGEYIYYLLNVSIYYPNGNKKWKQVINNNNLYGARAVRYYTWNPPSSKKILVISIPIASILILLIGGIILFIYCRRKRKSSSNTIDADFSFKKILNKN
jgi:hypothetical protein